MSSFDEVYRIARAIPRGRVTSYGRIARMMERPLSPKGVGWAMSQCPDDVPWQRVVGAQGDVRTDSRADMPEGVQRAMLEAEGVRFDTKGRVQMQAHLWDPAQSD